MFETKLGKTGLLVVLCGATFVASGCDRREREDRARSDVAQEVNEATREIGEAEQNLAERTLERERTEYRETVNGALASIDDRLDEIRSNIRSTPGVDDTYDADLDAIDTSIKRVKERLDDADDITVEGWSGYRTEVDGMMTNIETNVSNLEQRIRSKPTT